MGWLELSIITMLFVLPIVGVSIFLKLIKAGSKAYNKGKLEAESEHKKEQDQKAS